MSSSRTVLTGDRFPRGTLIIVGLAAAVVVSTGMAAIRGILAPVLLTLVLTICVYPVRVRLQRRGASGAIGTGAVMLSVAGLLAAFVFVFVIAFGQFVAMLPTYSDQIDAALAGLAAWLASIGVGADDVHGVVTTLDPAKLGGAVSGLLGSVLSLTGAVVIVFTMIITMGADSAHAGTVLKQLSVRRPDLVEAIRGYSTNVRRYMVVTTLLGVAQGTLNTVALLILHVPAALLWGVLSFLCSFIPNVGYFFAIAPPLAFGFLVGGWPTVVAIVVIYSLINAVVQSVIQPRVVGAAVSLSQTITFFSVLFWAVVIGPIGAILAIPLTLFGKAVLVDADQGVRWWAPVLGPTDETREMTRTDSRAVKDARKHPQDRTPAKDERAA
jgi:predicted PurR-regulated permease PerM